MGSSPGTAVVPTSRRHGRHYIDVRLYVVLSNMCRYCLTFKNKIEAINYDKERLFPFRMERCWLGPEGGSRDRCSLKGSMMNFLAHWMWDEREKEANNNSVSV